MSENEYEQFAAVLRDLMRERGLTQMDLSIMLGIRQSQVSNWLNHKSLPGYKSIMMLCQKLEVSPVVFFGE